ncbi:xanthine dehydrogenase, FAD-binding subunit XdhB [Gottschalkia acidurici 9a]|uniref:Xanthine dehydrogenase, FAD-binding subunit XdhB n=1 Tax=Gottschalkia acidurici (strain ATCC 7906 / DSM 604 / BCRC 14475 / CIP 104303 / KCTC 5404 / NCIMB 10678 / 9a) TaxID=1128398 RepID=K0B3H0_GOTA9|nr:FAD binding domain-containing protein [Gottschalkia acidurici]AFS79385.1 xanthine dehydrogenase, FAD-binding subunit XdhB [Gottschalkia acidurici 9a]
MSFITIGEYKKPKNAKEAYDLLTSKKNSLLIGGGTYIHLGSRHVSLAIDLSDADMEYIRETDTTIEIGAMTTFREIETNQILSKYFDNLLSHSVKNIIGVQFRNMVTVGATVFSKYGFSDFITALRVLDTKVVLYNAGEMTIDEFIDSGRKKDLLEKIIIKKENLRASFQMMRNSMADYAILNAAVSKGDTGFKIVVGARPGIAVFANKAMEYINSNEISEETVSKASQIASEELAFGTNGLGSKEYRTHLASALVKSALLEVI